MKSKPMVLDSSSNSNVEENIKQEKTLNYSIHTQSIHPINPNSPIILDGNLFANKIRVQEEIEAMNMNIMGDLEVTNINVLDHIHAQNIESETITTMDLISKTDLNLLAHIGRSINIPNIRHNVNTLFEPIISTPMIKSFKIFLMDKNVEILIDGSVDGMEIIMFNVREDCVLEVWCRECMIGCVEPMKFSRFICLWTIGTWIMD